MPRLTADISQGAIDVLPLPVPSTDCLFLDFDGTLVEIAERPDAAVVSRTTVTHLQRMAARLDSALAIITGRNIEDVDRMLSPLRLPVAGVHGLTRRSLSGLTTRAEIDQAAVAQLAGDVRWLIEENPGLIVETKWGAVALHYRARPALARACVAALERAARQRGALVEIVHGKMVAEAKFARQTKGTAVHKFMREFPFAGRRPVFIGDDLTDEDGFAAVHELGGVAAKVGSGPSIARYRFDDPSHFLAWLEAAANQPTVPVS